MSQASDPFQAEALAGDRASNRSGSSAYRLRFWARRYWWIVALTIMIGLALVDAISLFGPAAYISHSRMMVSGRVAIPQGELYNPGLELANFYGTQVALMKSPQIVNQAVNRVATLHPEVTPDKDAETDAGLELRTSIFDLKVTSSDPDYAELLLDSIMDTYLSSKRTWKNQTTDEAVSAITEEISHLDTEIRADEQELLNFQKNNNVVFIEEQSSSAATYLVSLNNELARITKEHDLLTLENKNPLTAPSGNVAATVRTTDLDPATAAAMPGNGISETTDVLLAEQDRIEKLKILKDQYGQYLKDAHPKMKDLTESLEKEQKFLDVLKARGQTERDSQREELTLRMQNLEQQIATWNTKSLELSQRLGTYQQLKNKVAREQALYNQLSSSIQNVDLNKSLGQEDVVIMEAASPGRPVPHNEIIRLLAGLAGGLVVGLLLVFFIARLDDKINSPLDIEENFDVPLIGEIPLVRLDKKSRRVPLVADDDDRYDFVEHHRDIRSSLIFGANPEMRARSLVITSAAPGEGKSTLAANLAATFAFSGLRVLLIDADLRRGIQHATFGVPMKPGLSNYLQNENSWRELVKPTKVANLFLLPRGKVVSRSGDLLLSTAVDYLIQESANEYDVVLWDTAPLFAAHDATDLCSRVGGVLFMTRIRHSSVSIVRAALNDLARQNARTVGIVLNAVKPGAPGYYSKYRYKEYSSI